MYCIVLANVAPYALMVFQKNFLGEVHDVLLVN